MRTLVWFRSDLRCVDNAALTAACARADQGVVAVFTICPAQWREHDWAAVKVEFLLRSLACLAERLKRLNIALRLITTPKFAQIPLALLQLARELRCDALHFNREYEVNEQQRDAAVTSAFQDAGLTVHAWDDTVIVAPEAVRTREGGFYSVFTPFKRAWLACCGTDLPALPTAPRPPSRLVTAPDPIPESIEGFDPSAGQPELWPAGEQRALRQLSEFVDRRITAYRDHRDLPALDGTSGLSPYLALGVLSPRRCLRAAGEANADRLCDGRAGPDTWISELIWREFYRHVLVGFPRVGRGRAFQIKTEALPWRRAEDDFAAWASGRTGVPIVDAGQRQLRDTGWMHNRVRMITAMFLAKDLLIDWRRGEQHFMQHLVDGDFASNNGGWQWSASTGTDAAPYFRIFNPYSQSKKFDPDGAYIRRFVPELRPVPAEALHDPARFSSADRASVDYPEPVCDHNAARARVLAAFQELEPVA